MFEKAKLIYSDRMLISGCWGWRCRNLTANILYLVYGECHIRAPFVKTH